MRNDQLLKTLPRSRKTGRIDAPDQLPMVNPELLRTLNNHGISLSVTGIDVLRLKGCESKKLYGLGIANLEQLANTSESALRIIPHFGIMKVRRLKARLNSYLLTLINDVVPAQEVQPEVKIEEPPIVAERDDSQLNDAFEFISELEAATQSLDKLKKRMHVFVAELKKNQTS
jgi:hypothetical protein